MIYVGIGSLQCSGDKRDICPIMLDPVGNITVANVKGKLAWHLMTLRPRNVYWVGPVHTYEDSQPKVAMNTLLELKDNMKNGKTL